MKNTIRLAVMAVLEMMKSNKGKNLDTKAHRSHITYLIDQGLDID